MTTSTTSTSQQPAETPRAAHSQPGVRARGPRTDLLRDLGTVSGRFLLVLGALSAIIWLLLKVKIVTIAAFLGFAQVALLWPVATRLRRHLPRALAVLLTVLGYLGLIAALLWFTATRLGRAWPQLVDAAAGGVQAGMDLAQRHDLASAIPPQLDAQVRQAAQSLTGSLAGMAFTGLGAIGSFLTVLVLAFGILVFGLSSGEKLWASIHGMVRDDWKPRAEAAGRALMAKGRLWLGASAMSGLVEGLIIGIGLWWLDVPLAVPLAVLTFFAGFIPYLGAWLAGAATISVALFSGGPTTALWALALVLFVQQVEGNVLQPVFMSEAMQFHPITTLLMATAGGIAFGFVGMLLTVPLTALVCSAVTAWREADDGDEDDDSNDEDSATTRTSPEPSGAGTR